VPISTVALATEGAWDNVGAWLRVGAMLGGKLIDGAAEMVGEDVGALLQAGHLPCLAKMAAIVWSSLMSSKV
jgi:hypothetical protein